MSDPRDGIDDLLKRGDLEAAARLARSRGLHRRAAELIALAGRPAEAVLEAVEAGEWRVALDVALGANDAGILDAVCEKLGDAPATAQAAAGHARLIRREDLYARLLERTSPSEAAASWQHQGEYARAAQCYDRAGQLPQAIAAFEQHLAQSPDDAKSAERLADLRAARGDFAGAVRALQSAARERSGSTSDADVRASAMRKLVDAFVRLGYEGSAHAVVRRLKSIEPSAPSELGEYKRALGEPASAAVEERYAGRYRVVREVGSGASGRVLEAVDELTNDTVALKVLSVGDDRGEAFGRFMREAELASVLDDPTLVRMRALDPEGPTIVFDWMPGGTLAQRIDALTIGEVRRIATRVLTALEILHRHGVVHRDVKPTNILFDNTGQARLGDLGAAHLGDLGATVTGGLVGSLPYMSPEQITGASATAATDLYAFGCVLFQMLTRTLPFPGPDYVTQHVSQPVPTVSSRRPALGTEYDPALHVLLEKDPDVRPADVSTLRVMLERLSWREVDDIAPTRSTSSIPPPSADLDERYERTDVHGHWLDRHARRLVERVDVPATLAPMVRAWASTSSSSLQAVHDVDESDGAWVVMCEAIAGDAQAISRLPPDLGLQLSRALQAVGVAAEAIDSWPVFHDARHGAVAALRGLCVPHANTVVANATGVR